MNGIVVLEKIAQWEKVKTLALDSVSSPITKRVYNVALNESMDWFQQAPRPVSPRPLLARGAYRWKGVA